MSDSTVSAEGAGVVIDPANANASAAASPGAGKSETSGEPDWLKPRLEQQKSSLLKSLGVQSLEDAKKAIDAAKAAEEALKSDAQKRGELESTLKAERAEKQAMAEALSAYAQSQMSALNDVQRNAVAAVAGEDPARQLKAIEALRPSWASAAPAAPPPPPKDTAPAPAAPKDGAPSAPPDAKAIYEELKLSNPILASRYALANGLFNNT